MNIFDDLRKYAGKWSVKASRSFSPEEISLIKKAEVVSSEFGNSVCFHLISGEMSFIPLSVNSTLNVGDTVDIQKAQLLTLGRAGDADIQRVEA